MSMLRIFVEAAAVSEYLAVRNLDQLDPARYEVTESIVPTDIARFKDIENRSSDVGPVFGSDNRE